MIPQYQPTNASELLDHYVETYEPSYGRLFSESVKFGFNTLWWREKIDEMAFDNALNSNVLTEDQYQNSQYYRPGIKWFEGMTTGQAQILAENHDRNNQYSMISRNVAGIGSLVQLGGIAVGSSPDPLAYIPYFGMARKGMKIAKAFRTIGQANTAVRSKRTVGKLGRIVADAGDVSIGLGIGAWVIKDKRAKFQEEWDMNMVLTEMAIGGLLGGGSMAVMRKFQNRAKRKKPEDHMAKIAMTLDQLEMGKSPDLEMDGTKGFQYTNVSPNTIRTKSGFGISSKGKRIKDETYVTVDEISTDYFASPSDAIVIFKELLKTANAYGFKGLFIPDKLLNKPNPLAKAKFEQTLAELGSVDVKMEVIPEAGGITIQKINPDPDDIRWDYKDVNEQYEYTHNIDEFKSKLESAVKGSLERFTRLPEKIKKRYYDIKDKSQKVNDHLDRSKKAVLDAARCVTTNG